MKAKKTNKASLENKKGLFVEIGLVTALALMLVAFSWSSKESGKPILQGTTVDVPVDWNQLIDLPENATPPPPVPVISDILLITSDPNLPSTTPNFFNPEDTGDPIVFVPYMAPKRIVDTIVDVGDPDITVVQEKPTFMGGDYTTFPKWVQQNVVYPQIAVETGQDGKVFLRFRIGKDGKVGDVQVVRSVSPALDAEAVRVILSSPKWTAARQNNKPVAVFFTMPVTFRLQH